MSLEFGCEQAGAADFAACGQDTQSSRCESLLPDGRLLAPASCLPPITSTPLAEAQTRCYELVDQLCARTITCAGRSPSATEIQDCEDDVTTNLTDGMPCLLAARVGAGYASCLAAIPAAACDAAGASGVTGWSIPSCASALVFAP
ncbi:MAG: hypothetical protein ABUS79_04125 [Pseudomonadota bacterium]